MTLLALFKHPAVKTLTEVSIKVIIFILLIFAIYKQVFEHKDLSEIIRVLESGLVPNTPFLLVLILLMMVVNWTLEAVKWYYLIRKVEPIIFGRALLAIFAGVTFTLFTPNRIGEYGGRFIFLEDPLNGKALMATLLGSIAQIVVTIALGIMGVYMILEGPYLLSPKASDLVEVMLFIGLILLLLLYYRADLFSRVLGVFPWPERLRKWFSVLTHYSKATLTGILSLSVLRYVIYTFQYMLLLYVFGVDVLSIHGFFAIAAIFLIQTVIPSIAIIELGIRGNVALFVLSDFAYNDIGIIAAAFSLWFINLVVPSAIGYCIILSERILKA